MSKTIHREKRPDGTERKPIRVRENWVPDLERQIYKSKGTIEKEEREKAPIPGLTVPLSTPKKKAESSNQKKAAPSKASPKKNEKAESSNQNKKPVTPKASPKKKPDLKEEREFKPPIQELKDLALNEEEKELKRLKGRRVLLKKKLKEIGKLEERVLKEEGFELDKARKEKVGRKEEVLRELKELEDLISAKKQFGA
eukprot:TRINITY_DN1145_c0_g1_i4.p1 TRINITY_DN1145_c0_g1~~TRINITY_DN1145_c0_g1_i4.p1  ORF type:complete len:198 (+),score=55.52 TRINITY_DN1145_c0_g1_i4:76-669(+)